MMSFNLKHYTMEKITKETMYADWLTSDRGADLTEFLKMAKKNLTWSDYDDLLDMMTTQLDKELQEITIKN